VTLAEHSYPILVTGAHGLLGRALAPHLAAAAPTAGALALTDLADLDATDPAAVRARFQTLRPRTVFHLAAWTDVDGAESRAAAVRRLNVEAAENVARAAVEVGALLVHMSTDFIFDGTKGAPYVEDDPPSPLGVYAASKAESEAAVRAAAPDHHLIVRTAWLYGAGRRNFVTAILQAARRGHPLEVVTDQIGNPTWSEDLARALVALVAAGARGTFHACGSGATSRFELAQEIVRAAGLGVEVQPILTPATPGTARRPQRAALSMAKLEATVTYRFPRWQESVRTFLRSL